MLDTIDMLEAIGQDASLRYASPKALAGDDALSDASAALKSAIATGERSALSAELGTRVMETTQVTQRPHREEDDEDEDKDEEREKHSSERATPATVVA